MSIEHSQRPSGEIFELSDATRTRVELARGISKGWYTGGQVFAAVGGNIAIDFAIGEARPGVPMTPSTLVEWASATKAVTCCAAALLWERGRFDLDDAVAQYIPEFAAAGKQAITIRHLLTHTGGLTDPVEIGMPFEQAVAAVCAAPLRAGWLPGAQFGYNSVGMWIIAELVARLSGADFDKFVRDEIFEPLGLRHSWLRMPRAVFYGYGDQLAVIPGHPHSGTMAWVTWGRPTGGCHGPIRELGHFYAALLDHRLLSPPVLEAMTARHLCGARDETSSWSEPVYVDRGLGFALHSTYAGHSYGPHASRRTFGHGGGSWCIAFADPASALAAALYWNGRLDPTTQAKLVPALLDALYHDLGLASPRSSRGEPWGRQDERNR